MPLRSCTISHQSDRQRTWEAVTYTYSEDRCIYMGSPGFQRTVRIRDCTPSVIVKVSFNIAAYDATKCSDKVIHLSW